MKCNYLIPFVCFFLFNCEKQQLDADQDRDTGNTNGNTQGGNNNPGSNTQQKPVAAFQVDLHDCILPCQVNFTDQSKNTNGYYYLWNFGEYAEIDSQTKILQEQKFLPNPYYIYYRSGEKIPELHITAKKEGGTISRADLQYRIKVLAPQGVGGEAGSQFRPDPSSTGNIRVKTVFNNQLTRFDLQVADSKNSRIPNGIYRRGKPDDQPKLRTNSSTPLAPFYLITDPTKVILVEGTYASYFQYASAFIFQDRNGQIGYQQVGNGPFGL